MNTGIVYIRDAADSDWRDAYAGCEHATFFHSPQWSSLWASYSNGQLRPSPVLVSFTDGRSAVILKSEHRLSPDGEPVGHVSGPALGYGGWISSDGLTPEHGHLLKQQMIAMRGLTWRINPFDPIAARLTVPGLMRAQHALAIDLRGGSEAERPGPRAVRSPGPVQDGRIRIDVASDAAAWDGYQELYERTIAQHCDGHLMYGPALFSRIAELGAAHVRLWLAHSHDRLTAGAIVLYAHHHAALWHWAAAPSGASAISALLRDVTADARARGCWWLDLNATTGTQAARVLSEACPARPLPAPIVSTPAAARPRLAAA